MQPVEEAVIGGIAAAVVIVVFIVLFVVVTVLIVAIRRKRSVYAVNSPDDQRGLGESVDFIVCQV